MLWWRIEGDLKQVRFLWPRVSTIYYKFEVTWKDSKKKPQIFRFTSENARDRAFMKYAYRDDVKTVTYVK